MLENRSLTQETNWSAELSLYDKSWMHAFISPQEMSANMPNCMRYVLYLALTAREPVLDCYVFRHEMNLTACEYGNVVCDCSN